MFPLSPCCQTEWILLQWSSSSPTTSRHGNGGLIDWDSTTSLESLVVAFPGHLCEMSREIPTSGGHTKMSQHIFYRDALELWRVSQSCCCSRPSLLLSTVCSEPPRWQSLLLYYANSHCWNEATIYGSRTTILFNHAYLLIDKGTVVATTLFALVVVCCVRTS